jgi:AcrR family transcriptional regulator
VGHSEVAHISYALPGSRLLLDDRSGTGRRRNRRGEGGRLRDELIEAARELLQTVSSESDISIRAVTRAAGAAPQSFYLQFASIDELLFHVYALEFDSLRQALVRAAEGAGDQAALPTRTWPQPRCGPACTAS